MDDSSVKDEPAASISRTEPLSAADQAILEKEEPAAVPQPEARPGSTPHKSQTPNPLKGAVFKSVHPDVDEEELLKTFKRMDTDMDGHVTFNQIESEIPADLTPCEKRFVKEVYNIVSANTFFGSKEFILIKLFCRKIKDLKKELRDAFEETKDTDLNASILKFVELFQSVDRNEKGEISCESLKYILSTIFEKDTENDAEYLQSILVKLGLEPDTLIEKLDFLTYVPFLLSLEPSLQTQFVASRAKSYLE